MGACPCSASRSGLVIGLTFDNNKLSTTVRNELAQSRLCAMYADRLKPSHKSIKDYYKAVAALGKAGAKHEMARRAAFQELLTNVARKHGWTFVPERPIVSEGHRAIPDGTLLDEHNIPRGHWEAKDLADNLEAEVEKKRAKGYPLKNIIFENGAQAILYQNGIEVSRKALTDPEQLCQLLNVFLEYTPKDMETFAQAVAKFKEDVPELAAGLQKKIADAHEDNPGFKKAFADFFELCRSSLNPNISRDSVDEMLVQHLLTQRLFRTVFNRQDFTRRNVIANEVEKVIDSLHRDFDRSKFEKSLDYFYKAIEQTARQIEDYGQKQAFMNTVYEEFFKGFSPKTADTHGIVYTPQEIVDFMCASVDEVLQTEFGTTLGGKDVWILDPCTGTGNFMVNLINRIPLGELKDAYQKRLFANEIMLLPYYIAAMNIEHAYAERMGEYEPFEGLCFVDTLDIVRMEQVNAFLSAANAKRVNRQRKSPITVIIGNPPYNVGQKSENEQNKNRKYPVTDQKIRETYSADSRATNKNALSDMYVKFFRWAVDRLEGRDGIVCYVSNNSFVDQVAFDGMRRHLANDFTRIYHVDLHGNVRHNPKLSGTTHNVFGIQVGVGVTIAVRRATHKQHEITYHRVPENWTRWDKCHWLKTAKSLTGVEWQKLKPDAKATWLVAGGAEEFARFVPLVDKQGGSTATLFAESSPGVKTNRDDVVYDFNREVLEARVKQFIEDYNAEVDRYKRASNTRRLKKNVDDFVKYDNIKWSETLKKRMMAGEHSTFRVEDVRDSLYRPFTNRALYFSRQLIERVYGMPSAFPTASTSNVAIGLTDMGSEKPFMVFPSNTIPDLHLVGGGAQTQCFPFYVYEENGSNRRENVTDWALKTFREAYGDKTISKWDIFHYVYGMLHHPGYRDKFKDCLKRELPRIPFAGIADVSSAKKRAAGTAAFRKFVEAGEKLCKLHLDYEQLEPWPLTELVAEGAKGRDLYVVADKMRLSKDRKSLKVNKHLTLQGIPERVFDYRLGNRSALEWVIDQYQVKEDKKSGIRSDPNRPDDPEYIVRLVGQVIRVSMETLDVIDGLPESYGGPLPT